MFFHIFTLNRPIYRLCSNSIRKYSFVRSLPNITYHLSTKFSLSNKLTKNIVRNNTFDVNTNVAKDVILFKHENAKFFKFLNLFGISQYIFWSYLAYFAYTSLKDAPVSNSEEVVWWRKINLGENKYRNTLAIIACLIGYGALVTTWMYTLRSVRYLILRKGGNSVSFVTYTPFGENRIMTVDLSLVSCQASRNSTTQIPIKVKNKSFHYMLDLDKGQFLNPKLFDCTAGLKRNLK